MDRVLAYPGAIPQDTDILNTNRNTMVALGYLAQACIGTTVSVTGLACTPTSPASLVVNVGPGALFSMQVIDQNAYGSLAADTSDPLVKVGINTTSTAFTITPPGTTGYSQNFLIEAQFLEQGSGSEVLTYYNSSNPSVPYSGPSNSGTAQYTSVIQRVSIQVRAGTPAPAGTQTSPGADSGWTPLYIISVNNGQTQITSANITAAGGSPFLLAPLSVQRRTLMANTTFYVSATNGNDLNSGLQPNDAFATPQAAWNNLVANYDLNGYNATISIGAGSFGALSCQGFPIGYGGGTSISIVGAGAASTFIAGISAINSEIKVSGLAVSAAYGIVAFQGGSIYVEGTFGFGTCTSGQALAEGGNIFFPGNYAITGGAPFHHGTTLGGEIYFGTVGVTVTIQGNPAFTHFANVNSGGINYGPGGNPTFSGGATGSRYSINCGGYICTGTGNTSYLPGNASGTIAASPDGGFYN